METTVLKTETYDERAVANKILHLAQSRDMPVTSMQLLKLVYLAHGWSLVLFDEPTVSGSPQAWQYGPVYPTIYKAVKKSGASPVTDMIAKKDTGQVYFPEDITQPKVNFLESILNSYGKKPAFELSAITHNIGTPWFKTYHEIGKYQDIPIDFMREHFANLARERNLDVDTFRNMEAA